MDDDIDKRAIAERRARLIAGALAACALTSCGDEKSAADASSPKPCLTVVAPPISAPQPCLTVAQPPTTAPQSCLSFGCADGYEPIGGDLLTSRAQQTDPKYCVPKKPTSASATPITSGSAKTKER